MKRSSISLAGLILFAMLAAAAGFTRASASPVPAIPDSSLAAVPAGGGISLKGDEDGTVLRSLTVEGEDRISIEFARPVLDLALDARNVPGLDWKNTWEKEDLFSILVGMSGFERPEVPLHPWLGIFAFGEVARFSPEVSGAEHWKLTIVDSRGKVAVQYEGAGRCPKEISWDGLDSRGKPATPGLTYSFVMVTADRAGNMRSYFGDGFVLPPFRLQGENGVTLVFSGNELLTSAPAAGAAGAAQPIMIEAASWLNQVEIPGHRVLIEASARTSDQATALAQRVARTLKGMLLGDPDRVGYTAEENPLAPDGGTVLIRTSL